MTTLDPDLEAALRQDEEDEGNPPQTVAAEPATPAAPVRKNKGGRPKKKPMEPIAQATPGLAGAPLPTAERPRSLDVASVWERILEKLRDRGLGGSEMVTIGVTQISIGPNREEPKHLNAIPGEAVGGTRTRTPGEDLLDYLERGIHVPSGMGPCKYRLMFRLRGVPVSSGDANLGVAEVTLPSAADIRKRWEAINQLQRDRERDNDFGPMPRASYSRMGGYFPPGGEQPVDRGGGHTQVGEVRLPPPGVDPRDDIINRVWDMYERERRLSQRLGEAPPPPPDPRLYGPPPAQPGLTKADVASAVVETLQALGVIPKPGAAPAAPSAPPLTQPVIQQAVTAPMNAAKEFFTQMREFTKMKREMREMVLEDEPDDPEPTPVPVAPVATVVTPPPEDDRAMHPINEQFARFDGDPIMFGKQAEGETWPQYALRVATANPKITGALLEKGAKMLDASSFGKLVAAFTNMGGAQAQAARNLPQNTPVEAANGAPAQGQGWSPNIG